MYLDEFLFVTWRYSCELLDTFYNMKSFDCVFHALLLEKLKFYGITRPMHSLIRPYLTENNKYLRGRKIGNSRKSK